MNAQTDEPGSSPQRQRLVLQLISYHRLPMRRLVDKQPERAIILLPTMGKLPGWPKMQRCPGNADLSIFRRNTRPFTPNRTANSSVSSLWQCRIRRNVRWLTPSSVANSSIG
ncbi:uncharacterized protein LOC128271563 [Anopheles cruzii]|uniref:uncharacterized protein LOC128271563 n=1 Tax=Anopheles cruzii TaxID=68878 RepID=UPI0022EC671B|nr:uncharacterized protein LOC128271563 [Anopheles cruzii]